MKRPLSVMSFVLALTIFSTLYDEQNSKKTTVYRTISSVEVSSDGLCIEKDSEWGKVPSPLTKEKICKCHPSQCSKEDSEYVNNNEDKSYPIEIKPEN